MKQIFDQMDEEQVLMSEPLELSVDAERIKALTMDQVASKRIRFCLPKVAGVAASLFILFMVTGAATYALAGPVFQSYIQETLGFATGEVLLVSESIQNRHYKMTVEDFVYDGVNGEAIVSVTPLSQTAQASFYTDKIFNHFGHFSIANSIGEVYPQQTENRRYFAIAFTTPIHRGKTSLDAEPLQYLSFAFTGIRDLIKIPLSPTLDSEEQAITVPAQGCYPVAYDTIVYSKLGFSLLGTWVNEAEDFSNISISFFLKNGEQIDFVEERYFHYGQQELAENAQQKQTAEADGQAIREKVLLDGQEIAMQVVQNETAEASVIEGVDFIMNSSDEWLSGSTCSGYGIEQGYLVERSFRFQKSFAWEAVDYMLIDGVRVTLNEM